MKSTTWLVRFLIFAAALSSCASPGPAPLAAVTEAGPSPSLTTPPTPTRTATLTPLPATWTPVPTLPVEVRKKNLIELFRTNGACSFPCWWGISIGDPLEKVANLAPLLGESPSKYAGSYSYVLPLDDLDIADLDITYSVDVNQTVTSIEISLGEPSRFRDYSDAFEEHLSVASVLGRYGRPSQALVLVHPRIEPGSEPREYALFLAYEPQGFGIEYSGPVDSEDPLRVCSIKVDSPHLSNISLFLQEDPLSRIRERNRFYVAEFMPLDQVSSTSLDTFYQEFSEPGTNTCIEISADPWQ
jgi:hypothetical protein